MFCEHCGKRFSFLNKKRNCKLCHAILCNQCITYKTPQTERICKNCYEKFISVGNLISPQTREIEPANVQNLDLILPNTSSFLTNKVDSLDPKTQSLIDRLNALKKYRVDNITDVTNLESRLNQLQGISSNDKSYELSPQPLSEEEQISKLMNQFMDEARIVKMSNVSTENNEIHLCEEDNTVSTEDDPWCTICYDDAYLFCKDCDERFCKSCFHKSHKNKRPKHQTVLEKSVES